MKFSEVVAQTLAWLQRDGRVSYRALKREFDLDDDFLEDLKIEIIEAKRLAVDENGKILVWTGNNSPESSVQSPESKPVQSPKSKIQSPVRHTLDPRPQTLDVAAERRQLTVMFCDLVGSTALSAQLDPEELREVVRGYQQTSAEIIERFGGHIAQYLGDGLLVYFGYPVAHEDDATRAVRAGLEIVKTLRQQVPSPFQGEAPSSPSPFQGEGWGEGNVKLASSQAPHPNLLPRGARGLQVRIGIHTGPVVIGEMGGESRHEQLALGETPNIAARIQGTANPDEVMIGAATYRLVEGLFACEDRGQPELKGVATPLTLYRVVREEEVRSRFEVVVRRGLTPLIGRDHEYGLLQERWARVKEGTGQVVLLSGEPGIGKSRLVEALKATVESEGASFVELRCSPHTQNSALAPVIEHLQRTLQFRPEDTAAERLQKLAAEAANRSLLDEHVPLLAALLSLPHLHNFPALTFSPQKQKEKTYEALIAWLCREAHQQPVIYAWEDLHWVDPSTLELLTLFLQQVPTTRLLVVFTYRPEFTPPWGAHSYLSQLTLSRLGRNYVEAMVEKVTGSTVLPKEIVQQIVNKTDGVPLFVEELTKSVVEQNVGAYSNTPLLGIPVTLQDALMARLDRLGPAKEIAQLGATIGREFNYELLQAVSPLNEGVLQQGLKQLVDAELVFQSGVPLQARYLFKHALVQDTAYQSLLKSRRQQLHQTIGKVLEEQFPQTVETQPELVAHHFTEAGLIEQAVPYWQQAGQRAIQRSADVEAIGHFTKGLTLLSTLPDSPGRTQHELTLQIALGSALMAIQGFANADMERAYARALELCRQIGESAQLFPALFGLWVFYLARAELRRTRDLAEQLVRLARNAQDSALLSLAHHALGQTLFFEGAFPGCREYTEEGTTHYDIRQHRTLAFRYASSDPGVFCRMSTARALWHLGYPDQALRVSRDALALAEELSHPYSYASALYCVAGLHQFRQEERELQGWVEKLIRFSEDQQFPFFLAVGPIYQGWGRAQKGEHEEGMTLMRHGFSGWRTMEAGLWQPYFLALLAEVSGKMEQVEEGLALVAEALTLVNKTEERWSEAELYRLKGELTLQSSAQNLESRVKEAEKFFHNAIEIARGQQAKSLELRTATSLARLWQQQGKRAEAHRLLSEVYNWFTEGFDTKDLQEAKALLESLESSV